MNGMAGRAELGLGRGSRAKCKSLSKPTWNHRERRQNNSVKNVFQRFAWSFVAFLRKNTISDEEFLLLYDEYSSKNPEFEYNDYELFDLDKLGDTEWKANFRVEKRDLPALAEALQIPGVFKTNQRSIAGGMEGLYMLLKRFAYPCRYGDMIPLFGRPVPVICMITRTMFWTLFTATIPS